MNEQYQGHRWQSFGSECFSQWGEEFLILSLFREMGIDKPSYLDIGAYHPNTISNTALMYKRGSRGINVEPNTYLFPAFKEFRPEDINLNIGVTYIESQESIDYYIFDDTSPRNTMSYEEAHSFAAEPIGLPIDRFIRRPVMTLNKIVDKYANGIFPDFLNIDIEGFDYHVLNVTDFSESKPKIIFAESREPDAMTEMLYIKGYKEVVRFAGNILFVEN